MMIFSPDVVATILQIVRVLSVFGISEKNGKQEVPATKLLARVPATKVYVYSNILKRSGCICSNFTL